MIYHLKTKILNYKKNLKGWRTNRKIVVIESDDWGSIRMPSREAVQTLRKRGFKVDKCQYMINDALETGSDLNELFSVLQGYRDLKDRPATFTANTIVANPDFIKIKDADYKEYFFEPFKKTYTRRPETEATFVAFQDGINEKLFMPQLHGREHLNISRWMRDLKSGIEETISAFELGMTGISAHITKTHRGSYQAAFDGASKEKIYDTSKIIEDAANIFEQTFGFRSTSFISPNYVWGENEEKALSGVGVKFLQSSSAQLLPADFGEDRNIIRRYTGQYNRLNQLMMVRNATFEPSLNPGNDNVNSCLSQINVAFRCKKPAIISSHRVNYIDRINTGNRGRSLKQLHTLLKLIRKKWPDAEFMSSNELGELIYKP